MAFSNANLALLADAVKRNLVSGAVELPIGTSDIVPDLAKAAVSTGFAPTLGAFLNAIKDRPVSTLISFVAFAGGSGVTLPKQ